ncbi:MAG: outer membrane protein assembly factor BamD [Phycisphaerales bacterium]
MHAVVRSASAIAAALLAASVSAQSQRLELNLEEGWQQLERPADTVDRELLDIARRLIAEGEPDRARHLLDDWIDRNELTGAPDLAEALRLRGDARLADGNEFRALFDYERVIREFPGSAEFPIAVEREIDIAVLYLNGLSKPFLGLRIESAKSTGEELLIRAQERMPGSRLAERAAIILADYYYRTRDLPLATEMYDIFLRNYPDSPYRKRSMLNRVYATIATFKGPAYDGLGLLEAKLLIEQFVRDYPADADRLLVTDALLARIDESAAAQQLVTARWYLSNDDPASAVYTIRRLLREHPGTVAAARGLQILEQHGWLEPEMTHEEDTAVSESAP